ncbi:hypothetical protein V6N13_142100 [Hibiscus sabdariffa]
MVAYSVVVSVLWTPPPERHRRSSRVILVESLKIGGRKATVVRGFYTPLSSFQKCSDVTRVQGMGIRSVTSCPLEGLTSPFFARGL